MAENLFLHPSPSQVSGRINRHFAEILHRLRHQRDAARAVHAGGAGGRALPPLEDRRVDALRVLHHDPHRPQHHPTHAQGRTSLPNLNHHSNFSKESAFYNEV